MCGTTLIYILSYTQGAYMNVELKIFYTTYSV